MLSGRSMPPLVHPAHAAHAATQKKPAASGELFLSGSVLTCVQKRRQ